ncbi:MAG: glycosyl hydrolase [bacterium]|nr:glycosyl hydrolase [bacterium]
MFVRTWMIVFIAASVFSLPVLAEVDAWISSEDGRYQLTPIEAPAEQAQPSAHRRGEVIEINPAETFQAMLGAGASFERSSCYNLNRLPEDQRNKVIQRLVDPVFGIGMNLMRICIGTSDFTDGSFYTYDDLPDDDKDFGLSNFSIEPDRGVILPVLRQALASNPDLRFIAAPWSPPAWMKTNGSLRGGRLRRDCYEVFADYLARFIKAYEAEGIPIYALSPQNEPDYPNPDYPTCYWSAEDQRDFIRDYLGPVFDRESIQTQIWCWDHNWNRLDFPRLILRDPIAARFTAGVAFHLYEGEVTAQSRLHDEFPDTPIYFTEGSTYKTAGAIEIIDIFRNWACSYNAWVIMLDEHQQPNRGPHDADPTAIELLDDGGVRYNFDYFMYGHFSKFIARGALRVASGAGGRNAPNVAFLNPDGTIVLIVVNARNQEYSYSVKCGVVAFEDTLPARSMITYRWRL